MKSRLRHGERFPLDDEVIDRIVQMVEMGNYINVACAAVGVHRQTYTAWRQAGEAVSAHLDATQQEIDPEQYGDNVLPANVTPPDWQCYKLFWRLEQSEAIAESVAVLAIRKHFPDQWTAAMTFLERRFPQRWRKQQTFETINLESPGIDEQALISDPEAVRLMHDALQRLARGDDILAEVEDANEIPALDAAILRPDASS